MKYSGAYFITICTKDKQKVLWKTVGACTARPHDTDHLSQYGLTIDNAVKSISQHYSNVMVDNYVIMPNHIHIILILQENSGRTIV